MQLLSDLFEVSYGHSLELNRLEKTGPSDGIPFISRKMGDNGVAAYVKKIKGVVPNSGGELTCALSGAGVLSTFIQDRPYYTAFHIACLRPKTKLTHVELLYFAMCIRSNVYRYNYGRQANRTIRNILIPSIIDIPGYVYTYNPEKFVSLRSPKDTTGSIKLSDFKTWRWFAIDELFEIKKGKRLTKANMKTGSTPFIGSIDKNNGVREFIGQKPIHEGNTITVNYNGSVAEAFYQPSPFWASDDVNVLYPKFKMNQYIALFFITLIKMEKYRFNYGRKWHMERMNKSKIRIPVTDKGKPDYNYMDTFIKSLPFTKQA